MGYSYYIGVRHIVQRNAPFWNCNSIEDVINEIQMCLDITEFKARELFKPKEMTLTGTVDKIFSCIWIASDTAGIEPSSHVPDGLFELAPSILEDSASAPYSCELPGTNSTILVPNLPKLEESPLMDALVWNREFKCRNMETFGRDKITLGSLNAKIHAIELAIQEDVINADCVEIIKHILTKMKLAKKYDLFFTFSF